MSFGLVLALFIVYMCAEIFFLYMLVRKIFKFHTLTLKDTIIYPLLIVLTTCIVLTGLSIKSDASFGKQLLTSVKDSVDIAKLSVDKDFLKELEGLGTEGILITIAYYSSYFISLLAIISLSLSVAKASFKNLCKLIKRNCMKEITFVLGMNEDAKKFIKSLEYEKRENVIFVLDSSKLNKYADEKFFLEKYKITYEKYPYSNESEIRDSINTLLYGGRFFKKNPLKIIRYIRTKKGKISINFITFFDDDALNISFANAAKRFIVEKDCYGGFYYEKAKCTKENGNEIYKIKVGDYFLVEENHENKYDDYTNSIKFGDNEIVAYKIDKDNNGVFHCRYLFKADKKGEGQIDISDNKLKKDDLKSLYKINVSEIPEKNSKNKDYLTIKKGILHDNNCNIKLLRFKKPKKITFNITCDSLQQSLLDKILSSNELNEILGNIDTQQYLLLTRTAEIKCENEEYYNNLEKFDEDSNAFLNNGSLVIVREEQKDINKEKKYLLYNLGTYKDDNDKKSAIEAYYKDLDCNYEAFIDSDFVFNHYEETKAITKLTCRIVNGNLEEKDVFDYSFGLVRTFNKYEVISLDFIKNYSLASFIDEKNIEDCTLKDCDVNLYVLGYGKVNQILLRDILICNSFVEKYRENEKENEKEYELKSKRINVKVYEKNKRVENFALSNGFEKYNKNDLNESKYYPLPESYLKYPEDFKFESEISDYKVFKDIYDDINNKISDESENGDNNTEKQKSKTVKEIEESKVKKQYNFFLISLDTDSKNWSIASMLQEDLNNLSGEYCKNVFFVRTSNYEYMYGNKGYFNGKNIYGFGVECIDKGNCKPNSTLSDKKSALSYDNIIRQELYRNAKIANINYESHLYNDDYDQGVIDSSFAVLNKFKQKSNIYSIMGLYSKFNLIFNKKVNENIELSDEYYRDMDTVMPNNFVGAKKYEVSDILAFIEKERWNAFEIGFGAMPYQKEEAKQKGKKQVDSIYHICITTSEGLSEVNKDWETNYVKYDYDIINHYQKKKESLQKFLKNNTFKY